MDSKVQTKTSENRRTKYFIVGLFAVICVLSFQLYRQNTIKKELVRRKSFLVGKLYECRVASEKNAAKVKDKRVQNEQLMKDFAAEKDSHEKIKSRYNDLEASFQSKTGELLSLKKLADEDKIKLNELRESYDNAMSSVKSMQGKLNTTMNVCDKYKWSSQLLNQSIAQKMREIELCRQQKMTLEQEKQVLLGSDQDLRKKIEEMEKVKSSLNTEARQPRQEMEKIKSTVNLESQQPKVLQTPGQSVVQSQSPIVGQVQNSGFVAAQPSQHTNPDQLQSTEEKRSFQPQATPSFQRPIAGKTTKLSPKTSDLHEKTSSIDDLI